MPRFGSRVWALVIALSASALIVALAPPSRGSSPGALWALVDAAAQRLQTADPVAAVKFNNGSPIADPEREQQVIQAAASAAAAKHLDTEYVQVAFRDQIEATNAIEHARFAQWMLNPGTVPAAAPDLALSRATIDRIDQTMMDEIAAQWDPLHSGNCGIELDNAKSTVTAARELDDLYQKALSYATRSYCESPQRATP